MRKNLSLFLLLISLTSNIFAEITAEIEPNQVSLGDAFQLTLTMDGISTHHTPDLLPLQRDFEINSTQHRVSTTIINGQMETLNQWSLMLTPKRAGKLNIPAIHIGPEQSQPLTIDVSAQGTVSTQTNRKHQPVKLSVDKRLQIETKVNVKEPYVNQQILLTVKLIHQDQLLDANYQPPTLEEALILPLGDSEQYQVVEENQIFTVEEQRYALFPQKSGTQMINGAHFQALIYRGLPQRVEAKGKPILLNVKQVPSNIHAKAWLPAKALLLTEEYSIDRNELDEGTTLTRTIKIEARGLPSELLPTLKAEPNEHFGVYPEKPITKNSIHKQDVAGIKTLRITYLLNQPGEISLPAYSLTWFNTLTGKEEIARLPEKKLQINELVKKNQSHSTPSQPKSERTSSVPTTKQQPIKTSNPIPWLIALGLGLGWIMTLIFFLYSKKRPSLKKQKHNVLEQLRTACEKNHPMEARQALISWFQSIWHQEQILNLDDIQKRIDDQAFQKSIRVLSESLYASHTNQSWQGETLWKCVKNYKKKPKKHKKKAVLPKLNP